MRAVGLFEADRSPDKERRENNGGEIAVVVAEETLDYLNAPIKRVAALFPPVPFSPALESEFIPNEAKIITAVQGGRQPRVGRRVSRRVPSAPLSI